MTTSTADNLKSGSQNLANAFSSYTSLKSTHLLYDPSILKMKSVLREVANSPDSSFQGHSSGDVADRLAAYAKNHQSDGGILAAIQQSLNSPSNATKSSMLLATSSPGAGAASSGIMAATSNDPAFSSKF